MTRWLAAPHVKAFYQGAHQSGRGGRAIRPAPRRGVADPLPHRAQRRAAVRLSAVLPQRRLAGLEPRDRAWKAASASISTSAMPAFVGRGLRPRDARRPTSAMSPSRTSRTSGSATSPMPSTTRTPSPVRRPSASAMSCALRRGRRRHAALRARALSARAPGDRPAWRCRLKRSAFSSAEQPLAVSFRRSTARRRCSCRDRRGSCSRTCPLGRERLDAGLDVGPPLVGQHASRAGSA